ncbi:hypothetical protein GCM10010124_26450 [Pilimelia terevasa]|uniref:Uncharacterized protein n=1 Tax=Pilimelia terevasa TaxID=53372 RepID=A0A8J3BMP5_9ACTN|nr:hypothetical protein GCM10010124_26450 [Pilimelia terevasa]
MTEWWGTARHPHRLRETHMHANTTATGTEWRTNGTEWRGTEWRTGR